MTLSNKSVFGGIFQGLCVTVSTHPKPYRTNVINNYKLMRSLFLHAKQLSTSQ